MLTGAVFVQGHDYLRKNPTEPRKNRILVILMLVVQCAHSPSSDVRRPVPTSRAAAQLAFEIFASFPSKTAVGVSDAVRLQGLHRARRAAQDSTLVKPPSPLSGAVLTTAARALSSFCRGACRPRTRSRSVRPASLPRLSAG